MPQVPPLATAAPDATAPVLSPLLFPFPFASPVVQQEIARITPAAEDRVAAFLAPPTPVFMSRLARLLRGIDASTNAAPIVRSSHDVMREYLQLVYVLELKIDIVSAETKSAVMQVYSQLCETRSKAFVERVAAAAPNFVVRDDAMRAAVAELSEAYVCDHLRLIEALLCRLLAVPRALMPGMMTLTRPVPPSLVTPALRDQIAAQARAYATRCSIMLAMLNGGGGGGGGTGNDGGDQPPAGAGAPFSPERAAAIASAIAADPIEQMLVSLR